MRSLITVLFICLPCVAGSGYAKEASIGGDFSLIDQHGKTFSLQQLRGKVVLLFFGYTYCPDVCPTELSHVAMVLDALGNDADNVRGVFVSVDPERDTPQVLNKYVSYFNQDLIGLTGETRDIELITKQYKVSYAKYGDSVDRYSVDHSANLYVIDQSGQLSTIVPFGLPAEHLLEVVLGLLNKDV